MASKAKHYLDLNSKYLKEAEEFIYKEDYVQASKKLWGACAEVIKALVSKRGKNLRTHKDLFEYIRVLDQEHPDLRLVDGFLIANSLHSSFYEDDLPRWVVKRGADLVREFTAKIKSIM
ncbi:MAG: PaREP1 family protein [Nitrososphaerales archaeon]